MPAYRETISSVAGGQAAEHEAPNLVVRVTGKEAVA